MSHPWVCVECGHVTYALADPEFCDECCNRVLRLVEEPNPSADEDDAPFE